MDIVHKGGVCREDVPAGGHGTSSVDERQKGGRKAAAESQTAK